MSVTEELLQNNAAYAESFEKGDLPLPPAMGVAVVALYTDFINSVPWPGKSHADAMKMRFGIFTEVAGRVDCSRAPKFTRGASRGIMDR